MIPESSNDLHLRYLQRMSELYPTIAKASTEIINLQSIMNLPKGTEHFISDIHGEYEAFSHVLKNGSGAVKRKIGEVFGHTLTQSDKNALATLIYYPQEKMELIKETETNMTDWYRITLYRLIEICKRVASKYTRSKVRRALPADFSYVIEELITEKAEILDKESYYNSIVDTIIDIGRAEPFIIALSELIQRLVVDRLHIIGDIYDRGSGAVRILDTLLDYHSLDIQWGNHDIVWMGAASGSPACIASVLRLSLRYGNVDTLEDGYGINLLPLATFSMQTYGDDPCGVFSVKNEKEITCLESELLRKMHKAISVIQFKLEGQTIQAHPEFHMENRLLLDKIDFEKNTVRIDGRDYPMKDMNFPTIDPADPYSLTAEEQDVMNRMRHAFTHCEKLHAHMSLLLKKGSLYLIFNNNLLYHGCMPLDEDGNFLKVEVYGKKYSGKALLDVLDSYVRKAFFEDDPAEMKNGQDLLWYLWTGPSSPLYGKDKMTTFERYFVEDAAVHKERKNPYYRFFDDEAVMNRIFREFGLPENAHIVNGHVPVLQKKGESPVKCGGRVLIIDGGFSKAYQSKTGIAGYTLIYNSYGMRLVAHNPFTSTEDAIRNETDIHSDNIMVQSAERRLRIADTDKGRRLQERIDELRTLLRAYRGGLIAERQ